MRRWVLFLGLFSCVLSSWASESGNAHPVTDIVIVRTAEQLQSPHVITYRVLEWTELRGRWIFPDVGYFDTGYGKDQIWFVAGGADLLHHRRFNGTRSCTLHRKQALSRVIDARFGSGRFSILSSPLVFPVRSCPT